MEVDDVEKRHDVEKRLKPGETTVHWFEVVFRGDYPESRAEWWFEDQGERDAFVVDWLRAHIHDNFEVGDENRRKYLEVLDRDLDELCQELGELLDSEYDVGSWPMRRYTRAGIAAMAEAVDNEGG